MFYVGFVRIFLIGLPGVGKSVFGRRLARELGVDFVDTDVVIEGKLGLSVADIFKRWTQVCFRRFERECVEDLLERYGKEECVVVACGGGLPVYGNLMDCLLREGLVVHLSAPMELFSNRLERGGGIYPWMEGECVESCLRNLKRERGSVYERAHLTLDSFVDFGAKLEEIRTWGTEVGR